MNNSFNLRRAMRIALVLGLFAGIGAGAAALLHDSPRTVELGFGSPRPEFSIIGGMNALQL